MCKVSDKLKLCTCKTDVNALKHYWIFYSYAKGKNNYIVGEPMLPAFISPEDDRFNQQALINLLNGHNCFDSGIEPVDKDRLVISFTIGKGPISYGFEFKRGKWIRSAYDPLEWEWNHTAVQSGKILNALKG